MAKLLVIYKLFIIFRIIFYLLTQKNSIMAKKAAKKGAKKAGRPAKKAAKKGAKKAGRPAKKAGRPAKKG